MRVLPSGDKKGPDNMLSNNNLSVELESETGVFEAGETIMGQALLQLQSSTTLRSVVVELRGDAETTAPVKAGLRGKSRMGAATEQYFSKELLVFGNLGGTNVELPAGVHIFPFCYSLPDRLPSSFQGQLGRVLYRVSCVIESDWWSDDNTSPPTPFTVIAKMDLNSLAGARSPVSIKDKRQFIMPKRGRVKLDATLARPGVVCGENLKLSGNISASGAAVVTVELALLQTTRYTVQLPDSTSRKNITVTEEVSSHKYPRVLQDSALDLATLKLRVPALPPSSAPSQGGHLVHVSYSLRVAAKNDKEEVVLKASSPVVIGSVPLHLRHSFSAALAPPPTTVAAAALPDNSLLMMDLSVDTSGFCSSAAASDVSEDEEPLLLDLVTSSGRDSPSSQASSVYSNHSPLPSFQECGYGRRQPEHKIGCSMESDDDADFVPSYMTFNVDDPICV